MSSLLQSAPLVTVAYQFGAADAQRGEFCLPELYFACRDDRAGYARGYEAVAGSTLLSAQILGYAGKYPANMTDAEISAESEEYADDIADRQFWSRGGW